MMFFVLYLSMLLTGVLNAKATVTMEDAELQQLRQTEVRG
jgi:hypothetical protein